MAHTKMRSVGFMRACKHTVIQIPNKIHVAETMNQSTGSGLLYSVRIISANVKNML